MKNRTILLLTAAALAAVLLAAGHPILALVMFFLVDNALAPRAAGACYDNVLGTLSTATIVQEALDLVFTVRPELNSISLGFTDRNGSPVAAYGQPVTTRLLGIPAVQDFGANPTDAADSDVSITLNKFKQLAYEFTPQEYSGTNRELIRERAMPMAVALGNHMVDAIASLFTTANYPDRTGADAVANGVTKTVTQVGAGWDYSHLVSMRALLNKAGVPGWNRFYLGNSDVYASLLNDMRVVGALNNPDNAGAIKSGRLPQVQGFGLQEYPNLTAVAGGNLVAAAGAPDCAAYAQRIPRDPREVPGMEGVPLPGRIGVITNARTGLSVMALEYIALPSLKIRTMLIWMYGIARGNPNNLQLIRG